MKQVIGHLTGWQPYRSAYSEYRSAFPFSCGRDLRPHESVPARSALSLLLPGGPDDAQLRHAALQRRGLELENLGGPAGAINAAAGVL
jgi:hypothetical protein